jgi:hypothetical protein
LTAVHPDTVPGSAIAIFDFPVSRADSDRAGVPILLRKNRYCAFGAVNFHERWFMAIDIPPDLGPNSGNDGKRGRTAQRQQQQGAVQ